MQPVLQFCNSAWQPAFIASLAACLRSQEPGFPKNPVLIPPPALVPLHTFYQLQMGDDIMALIASVPRTMRTLQWAVQAGIGYKRLLSGLDPNLNPDAYAVQLSRLHDFWAQVRTCCPGCV